MKKKDSKYYQEYLKKQARELLWWFSKEGIEIQCCMFCQGYRYILWGKFMGFFGSGFQALKIVDNLEKEYGLK